MKTDTPSAEVRSSIAEQVASLVDEVVDERLFATGAQLYVEAGGHVLVDRAWGDSAGRPIDVDSVHPSYCATKPMLGLAVGHLLDAGLVALDQPVADVAPSPWVDPRVSIRQVLGHRAGLRHPSATAWRMALIAERLALVPSAPQPAPVYSELAAGLVLSHLVESVTGSPVGDFVDGAIVDPIGLDALHVTPGRALDALARGAVRVPIGGLPDDPIPLLSEQLPSQVAEACPAFGGLVAMRSLGRLYSAVRAVLAGQSVVGLPSPGALRDLVAPCGTDEWDPVLQRRCRFAGGFMTHLAEHRIATSVSASAIGHAAGLADCVALCDPEQDVSLALYLNGSALIADDLEHSRISIVDQIITLAASAES